MNPLSSRPLLLICLTAVLVRLAFIGLLPSPEAPDEYHHLWVIQFIRDHLCLPNAADVASGGKYGVYGSMPPFGYLPHILISRLFPAEHIVFFARFGSLVMGLAAISAAFKIGEEVFEENRLLARALPWLMVFHPQFAFLNSYLNSDSAAAACAAWIMYLLIVNLKVGLTTRRSAIIGALLGLIILCKYNGLTLVPVAALSVVAATWLHSGTAVSCLSALATMAAASGAVCLWWFWRNYNLFDGDVLGVNTGYKTFASGFAQPMEYKKPPWELIASKRWWRFVFFSYWGLFGHMTRWMWRPLYFVYLGWLIISISGWLKVAKHKFVTKPRSELIKPGVFSLLAICALTNLAAVLVSQLGGPQGRYFFISEVPLLALTIGGLARLGPVWGRRAVLGFVVYNALVCLGVLVMFVRLYGMPHQFP